MSNVTFVPVLTTPAGQVLTAANWRDAGVNIASFYLESLLIKPGKDYLQTLQSVKTFSGWHGDVVLNASLPACNRHGRYLLRSPYDGSKVTCTLDEVLTLCMQLQPEHLILPKTVRLDAMPVFPDNTCPYIPIEIYPENIPSQTHGIYLSSADSVALFFARRDALHALPLYISGEYDRETMQTLSASGALYFETDKPASDALVGKVYCHDDVLILNDTVFATQFEVLDAQCNCSTCTQKLTRAYLHHLLKHTPLLCQRFLMEHNAFISQKLARFMTV